jgi:hypothetical protein
MPPGVFDFLPSIDKSYDAAAVKRMGLRHRFIIDAFRSDIEGADVLDLASHDGRWCHAFAEAGAKSVVGIEGRPALVQRFAKFPQTPNTPKIDLYCGDLFDFIERQIREGRTYDIVGVLGIFYHITEHYRLLRLIQQLQPKLLLIDSLFATGPGSFVNVYFEDPDKTVNATASVEKGQVAVGVPSRPALEGMAKCLDYAVEWVSWDPVPGDQRGPVTDYYRQGELRRFTCALRPASA